MFPLQVVDAGGHTHECWTTTKAALTRDLPGDLRDSGAQA